MSDPNTQPPTADNPQSVGRPNIVLVVFLVMPLLFILAALVMIANDLRVQQADSQITLPSGPGNPAALVSFEAPDFQLNDLSGNPVSIDDYRGKILLLNFWQTTCPPCIREMPAFIAFMEDQPDDVTWLTVNFGESEQAVREFFAEQDFIGIPVVMDPDQETRYAYGVFGAPVTFFIDEDGVVQHLNIGEIGYTEMEAFVTSIRNSSG